MLKKEWDIETYEKNLWQAEDDMLNALEGFLSTSNKTLQKVEVKYNKMFDKMTLLQQKVALLTENYEKSSTQNIKKKLTVACQNQQKFQKEFKQTQEDFQLAQDDVEYYSTFMNYAIRRASTIKDFDQAWHLEQDNKTIGGVTSELGINEQKRVVILGENSVKMMPRMNKLSKQVELRLNKMSMLDSQPHVEQTLLGAEGLEQALKE